MIIRRIVCCRNVFSFSVFFHAYLEQQLVWARVSLPLRPVFIGRLQQTPGPWATSQAPPLFGLGGGVSCDGVIRQQEGGGGLGGCVVLAYESCTVEAGVGASLRDPQCIWKGGPRAQLPQCELTV